MRRPDAPRRAARGFGAPGRKAAVSRFRRLADGFLAAITAIALVTVATATRAAAPEKAGAKASRSAQGSALRRPAAAARPADPGDASRRQRALQDEQRQLQSRLARLKRQLADAEASQSEATDALRESEAAISTANRRLRELAQSRRQVERQIVSLRERSRTVSARQTGEERQLSQVLRTQLVLARRPDWHRMVDGRDPQIAARDLAYLDYVAKSKARAIGELRERREELADLEDESRAKQEELASIAADERSSRAQLLREQQARRRTLDRLARQIGSQRQSIATLARDEARLGGLVEELGKLLAEQARREKQRAAQAARAAADARASGRGTQAAEPAAADGGLPAEGRFAELRGKLDLPVKGEIVARFGSPRRTEAGVNAPTWKGVFIRAATGTDVHAVAAGRVVFADWLRGFGNLLILDHGEGFLSVYGNNESLLAALGAQVDAGEVIAAVGNTGGSSDSGLYFELRFQGRPFDPLRWAAAR